MKGVIVKTKANNTRYTKINKEKDSSPKVSELYHTKYKLITAVKDIKNTLIILDSRLITCSVSHCLQYTVNFILVDFKTDL